MPLQFIAVAAMALSAAGVTADPAPTPASGPPACVVTQAKHRTYVRAVFRERKRISSRARRRIDRLRSCAKTAEAARNMLRLQHVEQRARSARQKAASTPFRFALASNYGPGLYGNTLGCGGTLTAGTLGVAHKTMPCGTLLDICDARCVSVRVVDRGPYVAGREVDLTMATAAAIGFSGVGLVRLRVSR